MGYSARYLWGAFLLMWSAASLAADFRVPDGLFSGDQRGPYSIGTFEELWIDSQRDDEATSDPNDKRKLMIQVWYPAVFKGDPPRAAYALSPQLYPDDEKQSWMHRARAVRTTSVLKAPLAAEPRQFPVLIYNPGSGYTPFSATFQTEFLASQGYIVVAVGHSDVSRIERFPDGSTYRADRNRPAVTDEQRKTMTPVEELWSWIRQTSAQEVTLHVRDISFVLDRLQARSQKRGDFFYQRLDLNRVGSLGWSLGGAASFQASRDDERVKAAINFDGRLYTDAIDTGSRRPLLMMHADRRRKPMPTAADREVQLVGDSLLWRMFSHTDADWYEVTVSGTTHQHFSDLTLLKPVDSEEMHPRLAHDIANAFALEFFDRYLLGRVDTPLLSGQKRLVDAPVISSRTP